MVDGRPSDNYFMDFPAKMSDGRLFTDYKSSCIMNAKSLGMTSLDYRTFLINNGQQILNNNTDIVNQIAGCGKCSNYAVFPPYYSVECNEDRCIENAIQTKGVNEGITENISAEIKTHLSENRQKKIDYIRSNLDDQGEFKFHY